VRRRETERQGILGAGVGFCAWHC